MRLIPSTATEPFIDKESRHLDRCFNLNFQHASHIHLRADLSYCIDMSRYEMTADFRIRPQRRLKVDQIACLEASEVCASHGFVREVKGDLIPLIAHNGKTHPINGDTVSDDCASRNFIVI